VTRLSWFLLVAATGCTGYLDGSPAGNGSTTETPGAGGSTTGVNPGAAGSTMNPPVGTGGQTAVNEDCDPSGADAIGRRVLRRLTNTELETTLRSTFGLDAAQWPGVNLPSDAGSTDGFTNNVDSLTVGPDYAKGTFDGAKKLAALVSAEPLLSKLAPCSAQGGAACAETFVSTVGAQLYRRPLTTAEKARYQTLFGKISAEEGFGSFVYWATVALLQSPHLVYRSEIGEPDGARFKLSQYEIATQLAYTFTGGPPSTALTQLAAANQLASADQIESAARNLVFDGQSVRPAFRDLLLRFGDQWLGLGGLSNLKKDATRYPEFDAQVQEAMAEETRRFFSAVVLEDRGNVASLLTAPYTYVNGALADYYGFGAGSSGDFTRATRPANWGVGLLAQGSFLSVQANSMTTSPTRRGHVVRSKLLCDVVPPPPAVVGEIPPPSAAQTTRQRYEELHTANASCKGCHSLMDAIGFSLEHLDAAGRYRENENGFAINDDGVVSGTSAGDVGVDGVSGLANQLAKLPEVTDCVSSYVAAYALGFNHERAACLATAASAELRGGSSLLDFYVRLARSEHFRARQ
jgi:hypothetical protein